MVSEEIGDDPREEYDDTDDSEEGNNGGNDYQRQEGEDYDDDEEDDEDDIVNDNVDRSSPNDDEDQGKSKGGFEDVGDEDEEDDEEDDQDELSNAKVKADGKVKEEDGDDDEEEEDSDVEEKENNKDNNQQDDDNEEVDESDDEEIIEQDDADAIIVGGKIATPAYCILEGFYFDIDQQISEENTNCKDGPECSWKREILYIRHLPAILGRSHETKDPGFVGIGTEKKLSRQQLRIEYRTTTLYPYGQLQSSVTKEMNKKREDQKNEKEKIPSKLKYVDRVNYGDKSDKTIESSLFEEVVTYSDGKKPPSTGFFTLTTLGKNSINVNGEKIEPGETAYLSPGSIIKLSTCWFYFITPKKQSKVVMSVPYVSKYHESASSSRKKSDNDEEYIIPLTESSSLLQIPPPPPQTEQYLTVQGKRAQSLQNEIDSIPTDDLIRQMSNAIRDDVWDRKHQLIGSTLSYRAVIETAIDPNAKKKADENHGELSRGEIMDLIATNPRWKVWVEQMLSKMEQKSYQASITKGLIKAQFRRTATTGRYIKWLLPDLSIVKKKSIKNKSSSKSDASKTNKIDLLSKVKKEEDEDNKNVESMKKKRKAITTGIDDDLDVMTKKTRKSDDDESDREDNEDDDDDSLKLKPVKLDDNSSSDQDDEHDDDDEDEVGENDNPNKSLNHDDDDDNSDEDDKETSTLGVSEQSAVGKVSQSLHRNDGDDGDQNI
jgi:hypothetical protein